MVASLARISACPAFTDELTPVWTSWNIKPIPMPIAMAICQLSGNVPSMGTTRGRWAGCMGSKACKAATRACGAMVYGGKRQGALCRHAPFGRAAFKGGTGEVYGAIVGGDKRLSLKLDVLISSS